VRLVWTLPAGLGLFSDRPALSDATGLWECGTCSLWFRHPCPDQATLTSLYESVPDNTWSTEVARPSWPYIWDSLMTLAPAPSVLDIGCFTGDFLAQLPAAFARYGVEPNERAGEVAMKKGISIVGRSYDAMSLREKVGAVTLLDVIEHVEAPGKLLSAARDQLVDGGILVVLSGNSASWPWRLIGSTYWYSALPGHVRFLNPRWARHAAARLGMELVRFKATRGEWLGWRVFLRQGAQAIAFAAANALKKWGLSTSMQQAIPLLRRVAAWPSPPWWSSAPDHAIFIFKAKNGARS
jgi:SAM-dependent methyltransferase